jgi:hypothetical protein
MNLVKRRVSPQQAIKVVGDGRKLVMSFKNY